MTEHDGVNYSKNIIVIIGPSGAGKTTLANRLMESSEVFAEWGAAQKAITHTTRQPRQGERNGKDYHFVSAERFAELESSGCFVETASVFGCRYGTSKMALDDILTHGQLAVLVVDWQGAHRVRESYPCCLSVFVSPPSIDAVRHRLESRGLDAPETILARLAEFEVDMSHAHEADILLVNDHLDETFSQLVAAISTHLTIHNSLIHH